MYLCYIDESGTSQIPGTSSHYILAGLTIPIEKWKQFENDICAIKKKYDLMDSEIHTAWILRSYIEQSKIQDFEKMDYTTRKFEVTRIRNSKILKLQQIGKSDVLKQTKKNYRQTDKYIHLLKDERKKFVFEIAEQIGKWNDAKLFADCIDKTYYNPQKSGKTTDEEAFEQVVSRFEQFLNAVSNKEKREVYGLIIHDNNETVAKEHTNLMKAFHEKGTLWTRIKRIIETPLFVNSELTSMVQVADVCAYSLRRYVENNESDLFNQIYKRADRNKVSVVGVRHYADNKCLCEICQNHRKNKI